MRAMVYDRYGPPEVLEPREVETPRATAGQLLVAVRASSVTTADWRLRAAAFPGVLWLPGRLMTGLLRPRHRILGVDFAGEVAATGSDATRFAVGDRVFGFCGHGGNAEYVAVAEDAAVARIPDGLDFEQAAAIPFGGLAALVFLRDFAKVAAGQAVAVVGASGGVGAYAVQLARHLGAEVTGVGSAASRDLIRSLGAAHVVDYAVEDFTRTGRRYDVILDTVGATDFAGCRDALSGRGLFVPLNFGLREMLQALRTGRSRGPRVVIGVNGDTRADLGHLCELLTAGALRPVIDSRFPLEQLVEAHRHVETRHRRGAVVVTVGAGSPARD